MKLDIAEQKTVIVSAPPPPPKFCKELVTCTFAARIKTHNKEMVE